MSTLWLRQELIAKSDAKTDDGDPILTVFFRDGREERVYCPDPDEYRVTADVVAKASGMGATIIAFSSHWCEATVEGREYAERRGLTVIPYAQFFAYLRRKGVTFSR